MGHLLKRDERTDRDPRVEDFIPDTWQVCYDKCERGLNMKAKLHTHVNEKVYLLYIRHENNKTDIFVTLNSYVLRDVDICY